MNIKKSVLPSALFSVFILSFFLNTGTPEPVFVFKPEVRNNCNTNINHNRLNSENKNVLVEQYLVKTECGGTLEAWLDNSHGILQKAFLGNLAFFADGYDITPEILSSAIDIPLQSGREIKVDFVKKDASMWLWRPAILKFALITVLFLVFYGLGILVADRHEALLRFFCADWITEISCFYRNINPLYRQVFWTVFIVLNIVFVYGTVHFLWGNHDWNTIKYGITQGGFVAGRITENLPALLSGGRVLPVFLNLFHFAGFALSTVLLCVYWRIPEEKSSYLILSLLLVSQPFALNWIFFIVLVHFWLPAMVITALLISRRQAALISDTEEIKIGEKMPDGTKITDINAAEGTWKKSKQKHLLLGITATLIFCGVFFAYPATVNTVAVVLSGALFFDYFFERRTLRGLYDIYKYSFMNIIAGGILFSVSHYFLENVILHSDSRFYATASIGLKDLLPGLLPAIKASFTQLVLSMPFTELSYRMVWLVLAVLCLIVLSVTVFRNKNRIYSVVSLLLFLLPLVATQLSGFMAADKGVVFFSRLAFFGLAFYYVFIAAFIIRHKGNIYRNIALLFAAVLVPMGFLRDAEAQKVWKLGFDRETGMIERILDRIESLPEFDPSAEYTYVAFGKQFDFRSNYYGGSYDIKDAPLLNYPYTPEWVPHIPLQFYARQNYIKQGYSVYKGCYTPLPVKEKLEQDLHDFEKNAKPWPDKSSVIIKGNYIAVMFDKNTL